MFPDLTRDDVFRLETRRLWLRWPRLADVQALVRLAGEKAVAEMTGRIPHPYTPEHADRFVFETRRNNANGHGLTLVITPKGRPNAAIGAVGIEPDPEHGGPRPGYLPGTPHWGGGIATGAAGLIGGVVLGTRLGRKPKKVLGVKVPGSGSGLTGVAKQVKKAGKQLGKTSKQIGELTDEVRSARKKAEELGRAIS